MNELKVFSNEQFGKVRTVIKDGSVWFVLKDVCECLGLSNPSMIAERLDNDERAKSDLGLKNFTQAHIVNESGLYNVILRSDKPQAKQFKRWITHEVLPTIRKHGIYATDNVIDQILNNPDFGIELLTTLKKERKARLEAERKNSILMHVNKTYTATEIAKELGLKSAIELNKKLTEKKIQYKQNNTWVMYSKYADRGYEQIKQEVLDNGRVVYHRRFTQLGRDFILNILGEKEIEENVAV